MKNSEYENAYRKFQDFFGREPERLVRRFYKLIEPSGPVLDVGSGQGRNALFLARKGYSVDAIDISKTAIETLNTAARRENLKVRAVLRSFEEFTGNPGCYEGILLLGLIQVLSWDSISLLQEKVKSWAGPKAHIFVTAFTTADSVFEELATEGKPVGRNSFIDDNGYVKTFLEPGELPRLFPGAVIIHLWEGLGPYHRHAGGPLERHAGVKAVLRYNL